MTSEADHPTTAYPAGGYQSGRLTSDEASADGANTDRVVAERPVEGHRAGRAGYTAAPPVAADAAVDEVPVVRRGGASATAALVFGMIALVTSFTVIGGVLFGLLALTFGVIGSRRAKRGLAFGRGRAIAGILTGLLGLIIAIALVGFGVSILNTPAGKDLKNCLSKAGTNASAIQTCRQQYDSSTNK